MAEEEKKTETAERKKDGLGEDELEKVSGGMQIHMDPRTNPPSALVTED